MNAVMQSMATYIPACRFLFVFFLQCEVGWVKAKDKSYTWHVRFSMQLYENIFLIQVIASLSFGWV